MGIIENIVEYDKEFQVFCENNNIDFDIFKAKYPHKVKQILIQDAASTRDELDMDVIRHMDPNMITLFDEDILPKSRGENAEFNYKNIKKYNRYNVVAFNASVDKARQEWEDIPDMSSSKNVTKWPQFYVLKEMIEYGDPQEEIESFFPECFKGWTILPSSIRDNQDLIAKFYSPLRANRRFKVIREDSKEMPQDSSIIGSSLDEDTSIYQRIEDKIYPYRPKN